MGKLSITAGRDDKGKSNKTKHFVTVLRRVTLTLRIQDGFRVSLLPSGVDWSGERLRGRGGRFEGWGEGGGQVAQTQ